MSLIGPFGQPGRFWRGNLHAHSTVSDGGLSPAAIRDLYRAAGYDFVAITDHFLDAFGYPLTDITADDGPDFVSIPSAELHAGKIEAGEHWHLLGIGLPAGFAPPSADETGPTLAGRALAAGAFVAAAHPAWYGATPAEVESLGPIHAVEVWNATVLDSNDRPDSWYVLDQLLSRGRRYLAIAADDAHFRERPDALQAWVWVKAERLGAADLVSALMAGSFYASTGPELRSIEVDEAGSLRIECSPVDHIFVTARGSQEAGVHGTAITEAVFDLERIWRPVVGAPLGGFDSPFCRVTIRDAQGRRAWSNPIWLAAGGQSVDK
jgi:hypothetical protein